MKKNHSIYERFTRVYEILWNSFFKDSFGKVCHRINELEGETVLEVGIGPGETLQYYDPLKSILGIDVSGSMIENANRKIVEKSLKHCRVQHVSGNYPFAKNSFDIVASFSVVTVVKDPVAFIDSLVSLVKPGGYLVIVGHFENESTPFFEKMINMVFEPFTKICMGFVLRRNESVLFSSEYPLELKSKFDSGTFGPLTLNTCYILKKL